MSGRLSPAAEKELARRVKRIRRRTRWLPYWRGVPWQLNATDGPYLELVWRGHRLLRRPWPQGRTEEQWRALKARAAAVSSAENNEGG